MASFKGAIMVSFWLSLLNLTVASFQRQLNLQEVNRSHRDATEHLTSDLRFLIGAKKTSMAKKFHLSTQYNLPYNYPFFFNDM